MAMYVLDGGQWVPLDGVGSPVTNPTVPNNPDATVYLAYSTSSSRSSPQPLHQATITGPVSVFTLPDTNVVKVQFSINGQLGRTENNAPFDLLGADTGTNLAYMWSPDAATYNMNATITFSNGTQQVISASFNSTINVPVDPDPDPDPIPGPAPTSGNLLINGRYAGPWTSTVELSTLIGANGDLVNGGLGRIVNVPNGTTITDANKALQFSDGVGRTGWVNLVAAQPGGYRLENDLWLKIVNGRAGVRFIGMSWQGQLCSQGGSHFAVWYGHGRNPNESNASQPAVWQSTTYSGKRSSDITMAGVFMHQTVQDCFKPMSSERVLLAGIAAAETKYQWALKGYTSSNFHSDGYQQAGRGTQKITYATFIDDARLQASLESNSSGPGWLYFQDVWHGGSSSHAGMIDGKSAKLSDTQDGRLQVVIGPRTQFAGKVTVHGNFGYKWGSQYGGLTITGGATRLSGINDESRPASWPADDSSYKPLEDPNAPHNKWVSANPYSSWQTFFADPAKSTFLDSPGGKPSWY